MDDNKFIQDINRINFSTPELAAAIRNILYAHLKIALRNEQNALQYSINNLPTAANHTDIRIIEEKRKKYQTQLQKIHEKLQDIETKFPNTPSAEPLSREHITEFAKAFRNIHHLQRFLVNAPPTIKGYETDLILELLAHLNQEELQTQLELLSDDVLKERIEKDNTAYIRAVHEKNFTVRDQAQKLAQTAALIIIKRKCLACQREAESRTEPVEIYKTLLNDISQCIPDVGSSTIIDDISSTQIPIDAEHPEEGTTTIAKLLYDTRERLGLHRLPWHDPRQLELMLPSRHFYQKLRFGQEDRRIYAAMRRKNLAKDLFMARNIYDVKQFTEDPEKTSDTAFAKIEQRNYERRIQELIRQKSGTRIAPSEKNLSSYKQLKNSIVGNTPDDQEKLKILGSKYTLYNLEKIYSNALSALDNLPCPEPLFTVESNGSITVELNYFPVTEKEVLDKLGEAVLVYRVFDTVTQKTLKYNYFQYKNESEKTKIINQYKNVRNANLIREYRLPPEKAYEFQAIGSSQIPKETKKSGFQGLDIASRVRSVISEHGRSRIVTERYNGKDLNELIQTINSQPNGTIRADIKEAFVNSLIKFKNSVKPTPRTTIAELKIEGTDNEAKIRALVELREFFLNYRKDSNNPSPDLAQQEQEQKLTVIFADIDNGHYEAAIQAKEIDKIIREAYTWISNLSPDSVPQTCRSTYIKSAKIAESTRARNLASISLTEALDPQTSPEDQKTAIRDIFLAEYSSDTSDIILPSLGITQDEILDNIDLMAEEYVDFAEKTRQGQFTITPEQEHDYEQAIQQVIKKIKELESTGTLLPTDLNKLEFKISHKSKATIKANGKEYTITVNKLPYSLIKSPDSDHLRLSYGGSRGAVAKLPLTEKTRYFTNWRLYGVGQYGTVKRSDDFVTGEGSVIKSGYIKTSETSTYQEVLRQDARYRDMTSRDDPNSGTERNVLQAIAWAKKSQDASTSKATEYWSPSAKSKQMYTLGAQPKPYKMVQPLAKGMSYKDQTDSYLNGYPKGRLEFHQFPKNGQDNKDLNNALALSLAIVNTAQEYHTLGFTHNDLKPENFMSFQKPDGTYKVEFIDWATGGFKRIIKNDPNLETPVLLFKYIFGNDLKPQEYPKNSNKFFDEKGRFLWINRDQNQIKYGINPSLEILHSGRNCTLPYIAPNLVLGRSSPEQDFNVQQSAPAETEDPSLTTHLVANDPTMDNWALTALTFGICNRKAYFALARGRAVNDYTVPGVIETDGDNLVIANPDLFNQYFSPESDDTLQTDMSNITDPNAVMFIPSTLREGQPLHLYQRLKQLLHEPELPLETREKILGVLTRVHKSVADGVGLNTQDLTAQLKIATKCLQDYEQQQKSVQSKHKAAILTRVLEQFTTQTHDLTNILLFDHEDTSRRNIEILCTYPLPGKSEPSLTILNQIDPQRLQDLILGDDNPVLDHLLISTIEHHQPDILTALIKKIEDQPAKFKKMVIDQGLLMYALQQGMTDSARQIIEVLVRTGTSKNEIFQLLLTSYGPGTNCPYIRWERDALHAAIRNNNKEQLDLILENLPDNPNPTERDAICQALFFSADLLNDELYQHILDVYNVNPRLPIRIQDILTIRYHDAGTSPFHLFLSKSNLSLPPWDELKNQASNHPEAIKNFLLQYPYPAVVAAENRNFEGLLQLFALASEALSESEQECQAFLQQTDRSGANLLNHILNGANPDLAYQFIQLPGMSASILYKLLKNPHHNPLKPYLNSYEKTSEDKYKMLNMLLAHLAHLVALSGQDGIATPIRNILCKNSKWLIAQANDPNQHQALDDFFSSSWLGQEKLSLFTYLLSRAEPNSTAQDYYKRQLEAYTRTLGDQIDTVSADIDPVDFAVIHDQTDDLTEVLNGLLVSASERTKKLGAVSQSKIQELKSEKIELSRKIQELNETNQEYETQYRAQIQEIKDLTQERDKYQQEAKSLEKTMTETTTVYERKLRLLKEENERNQESFINNQTEMTTRHQLEMEKLQVQLNSLRSKMNEKDLARQLLETGMDQLRILYENSEKALQQLNETLSQRETEIVSLKATQGKLEKEIQTLQSSIQTTSKTLETEIEKNKILLETLQTKEKQLLELENSSSADAQEKLKINSELQKEIEILKFSLEQKLLTIEDLQEQFRRAKEQAKILSSKLLDNELTKTELNQKLQKTLDLLNEAKKHALANEETLKLSIHSLETNVSELKNKILETDQTLQEKTEEIASLQSQLEHTDQELVLAKQATSATSQAKQNELETVRQQYMVKLSELQNEVTDLKKQITQHTETNRTLTIKYNESFEKSETLSQQLVNNAHQLLQQQEEVLTLSNLLQKEQSKNQGLEQRLRNLETEVLDLSTKVKAARKENIILIDNFNLKKEELAQLQTSSHERTEENLREASKLQTNIQNLEGNLKEKQTNIEQLQEELKQANQKAEQLTADLQDSELTNTELGSNLQKTQTQLKNTTEQATQNEVHLTSTIQGLEQTVSDLTEKLKKSEHTLQTKQKTIKSLQTNLTEVTQQLSLAKQETSEASTLNQRELEEQRTKYIQELELQALAAQELKREIEQLTQANKILSSQCDTSSEQSASLYQQLLANTNQLTQQQQTIDSLTHDLEEEQLKNQDLEQKLQHLEDEVRKLSTNLSQAHKENITLIENLNLKKEQLHQVKTSSTATSEENRILITKLNEEISELQYSLKEHLATIHEQQKRLEKANQRADQLDLDLNNANTEKTQLSSDLQETRNQLELANQLALQNEIQLNQSIQTLTDTVEQLSNRVHTTNEKLKAYQNTVSELQKKLQVANANLFMAKETNSESATNNDLKIQSLKSQLEQQNLNLQSAQREIMNLTLLNKSLSSQNESATQRDTVNSQILVEMHQKLNQQKSITQEALSSYKQEQEKTRNLEQKLVTLEEKVSEISQTLQSKTTKVKTLTKELGRKEKELERLRSSLTGKTGRDKWERNQLNEDITRLTGKLREELLRIVEKNRQLETIQAEYQNLKQQTNALFITNVQLESKISTLENTLNQTKTTTANQIIRLQEKICALDEIVTNLKKDIKDVSQKLEKEKESNDDLINRLEQTNQALIEERSIKTSNERTIQLLTSHRNDLTEQLEKSKIEFFRLNLRIESLQSIHSRLVKQYSNQGLQFETELRHILGVLQQKQLEVIELSLQVQEEQFKNQDLDRLLKQANTQILELEYEVSDLKNEIATSAQRLNLAQTKSHELNHHLNKLKNELQINYEKQEYIRTELKVSQHENASLNSQLRRLEEIHNDLSLRHENLLTEFESIQENNTDLWKINEELKNKYDLLNRQYLEEGKGNQRLQKDLKAMFNELTDLRKNTQKLEEIIQEKDFEIEGLHADICSKNEQIENLETECHRLRKKLFAQIREGGDIRMIEMSMNHYQRALEHANAEIALLKRELDAERGRKGKKYVPSSRGTYKDIDDPRNEDRNNPSDSDSDSDSGDDAHEEEEENTTDETEVILRKRDGLRHELHRKTPHGGDDAGSDRNGKHDQSRGHDRHRFPNNPYYENRSQSPNSDKRRNRTGHDHASSGAAHNSSNHFFGKQSNSNPSGSSSHNIKKRGRPHQTHDKIDEQTTGSEHSFDQSDRSSLSSRKRTSNTYKGNVPVITAGTTTTANASIIGADRTLPDVRDDINIALGNPHPGYSTAIHGPENDMTGASFVRLSVVDLGNSTIPEKKLLDATTKSVTVYRRLTKSRDLTPEIKAKLILKAMGIPPQEQFDFPDELVVNTHRDASNLVDNGANTEMNEIIRQMFRIYEKEKLEYDDKIHYKNKGQERILPRIP